jgi:hypothetical protein
MPALGEQKGTVKPSLFCCYFFCFGGLLSRLPPDGFPVLLGQPAFPLVFAIVLHVKKERAYLSLRNVLAKLGIWN